MVKRLIYLISILVSFIPAIAFAIGLEASISVWKQDLSGYVSYESEDRLDIDRELNYGKKTKFSGRMKIDMPSIIPNIYLMATPISFDGRGKTNREFEFGDKTFSADIPFYSKVQLDQYDIAFYYSIPGLKRATQGILNVELGLNARIIKFYAKVEQEETQISESVRETIPIPMVYAGIQVKPIDLLKIEGEARGIAYGSNHYWDLIGRLKIRPIDQSPLNRFFISGGYRYQELKVDHSDIKSKIKLQGPFIEVGIEF